MDEDKKSKKRNLSEKVETAEDESSKKKIIKKIKKRRK
jgi:hypothetical protein